MDIMSNTKPVGAKVTPDEKEQLEHLAYEYSIPGNQMSVSDVIRRAIRDFLSDPATSTEFWDKASNSDREVTESEPSTSEAGEGV